MKCPDCGIENPSIEHLKREYLDLQKHCFGFNLFCNNARKALNQIVDILHAEGIMEIDNLFGAIPVRKWINHA
jgi:hypothetical protein